MRPTRLELDGFGSYSTSTTVDFTDVDVFALSGPTGAGKSTIIDAMIFGLYGTVPRYGDRRLVAPVISQGATEARVRLDFTVAGQTWTAVRVVRRTATGATTKEARLERWTSPDGSTTDLVAGAADEVTSGVERLLGLSFEHFTTCVVLPQGAFQHFLHAKPGERQKLLVQLLDLDLYGKVGQAARERASTLRATAEAARSRLDGWTEDPAAALPAAEARLADLVALVDVVDGEQAALDALLDDGRKQAEDEKATRARVALLDAITVPDDVASLAAAVADATTAVATADAALSAAGDAVDAATTARGDDDPAPLQLQRTRLQQVDDLSARLEPMAANVATQAAIRDQAVAAAADAEAAVDAARQALERAQRDDLAATLTATLHDGDDCPVCGQRVDHVPTHEPAATIEQARTHLDAAVAAAARAREAAAQADRAHTSAASNLAALEVQLDEVRTAITDAGLPSDRTELMAAIDDISRRDGDVRAARDAEKAARQGVQQARTRLDAARSDVEAAWQHFDDARRTVETMSPPTPPRDDLAAAWAGLTAWSAQQRPELQDAADRAKAAADDTRARWARQRDELDARLAGAAVERRDGEGARDAVVRVREEARTRVTTLRERAEEAERLRKDAATADRAAVVATELGQHLTAKKFERWLLDRALRRLVAGATLILRDLSNGAYSMVLDDQSGFQVIDHHNADQVRSVRTLSGGETFLASLALALALSDHVADLASNGAARLESLILDEGFGTLDASTLDVVAAALEELGSRGRMVGVITHVATLAQSMPVRFEVSKAGAVSSIERIMA